MKQSLTTLRYCLLVGAASLTALLPLRVLYVVSDAVAYAVRHWLRYRRHVVRQNLERSFPTATPADIDKIENDFYRHLCDLFVETIKLLHISEAEMQRRVEVYGAEQIETLAADGRPFVILLGHYGNWEWVQEVTTRYRTPLVAGELYKPLTDKAMDRLMSRIRGRWHTVRIPTNTAVRQLLTMARGGEQFLVGFIADQRPYGVNKHHWTTFLHQETAYVVGGEEIARHTRAHVLYLDVEKSSRGHYTLRFVNMEPLIDPAADYPYSLLYMQLLEQTIRRQPAYWLWSHRRWRARRPSTPSDGKSKCPQS